MWNKLTRRISIRLAILLTIVAVFIVAINASFIYSRSNQAGLIHAKHNVQQLIEAVRNTAAISAYVEDKVLGKEVVDGLKASDLISAVELRTNSEILSSRGVFEQNRKNNWVQYSLQSPFDKNELIGMLIVQTDQHSIKTIADKSAMEYVIFMSLHSVILIFAVVILLNYQLISTVKSIASSLHGIILGSSQRVHLHGRHKNDEIGMLASDINQLLSSVEETLVVERGLREEVESLERRFRTIFEQGSGGIALIDSNGFLKVNNPSFAKILGVDLMQRIVSYKGSLVDILTPDSDSFQNAIELALNKRTPVSIDIELNEQTEIRWVHCLISQMKNDANEPLLEINMHDISERRNREQQFKIRSELDPLTGLLNRRAGKENIQSLMDGAAKASEQYALLMIDLDNFKPVNDTYGHDAGDKVLMSIANMIKETIRSDDLIIRWGGDEFVVFIKQNDQSLDASRVAEKLLDLIQSSIKIKNGESINIGASIGIAVYPEHGFDVDILVQRADKAMYQVKAKAKNGFGYYSSALFSVNSD